MPHTIRDKEKLINRVHRIRGQVDAVEKALDQEHDGSDILHIIAAARGALNSLMAEVLEGHIRLHLIDPDRRPTSAESKAAQDVIDVLRIYLK
jgi:DNA-binding FrmR family transcriptional regulator